MDARIVSFELPGYLHPEFAEDESCPVWQALQVTAHEVLGDGETVVTERMSATDPRAAAFRGHPAIERDHSADYVLLTTDSPVECDGFGTIEVGVRAGWRVVAVRREHEAWQVTRYDVALPVVQEAA